MRNSAAFLLFSAALLAAYPALEPARGQSVTFEFSNVRFRTGSSALDPASYPALDSLAMFLRSSGAKVEISGHTDNVGSASANRSLSQRRAESVKRYLVSRHRIQPSLMAAKGYGPSLPRADNFTAEGRAQNRRVEIKILSDIRTARVSFVQGSAFVRKQGVSRWEPVSLGRVLTVMDELATDSTGRVEVTFDNGSRLKLRPKSGLVITKMTLEAGREEAVIDIGLSLGKISAKVAKLQMKRERFSVGTPTAVAGIRGTEFILESRADRASLLSVWEDNVLYRGRVEGSMDKPVPAGQGCLCLPNRPPEPPVELPKPPMPKSPQATDTLFYNPDSPKPFTFAWETPPGLKARLVVARDAELNDVLAELVTADHSFQIPAQKVDRLYWQLNSVDSSGFEGQPWPLRSAEVRRKLDGPGLNILHPLPGQRIGRHTVLVQGSTDPKSAVTVNGAEAALDPNGVFSSTVALAPGDNILTIVSMDRADNSSTSVLNISCAPTRRFWVGPCLGGVKLLGGEWDMSTIGPSGGVRFLAGLNDRLSLGAQAGYAQVGCIYDQAFEPRGESYQTTLLSGAALVRVCPLPELRVSPYAMVFAGAVSWTNDMDTTTIYKDFGTPEASQDDLSPHAGLALGAKYQATESVQIFIEASGGYLSTKKYNVGHYDSNNLTASVQAGVMFGF